MKPNTNNKILDSTQPTQYPHVSLKVSSNNPKVLTVIPRLRMVPPNVFQGIIEVLKKVRMNTYIYSLTKTIIQNTEL